MPARIIDISIDISSPSCTIGDLFGQIFLTSANVIAPYCRAYLGSRGTCSTIEGDSLPVNLYLPSYNKFVIRISKVTMKCQLLPLHRYPVFCVFVHIKVL